MRVIMQNPDIKSEGLPCEHGILPIFCLQPLIVGYDGGFRGVYYTLLPCLFCRAWLFSASMTCLSSSVYL